MNYFLFTPDTGHYKVSSRTWHTRSPCRVGGTPAPWRIAKTIRVPATRKRGPNTSAHCVLVSVAREDTTQRGSEWNNAFTHIERERTEGAKLAPVVCMGPSQLSRPAGAPSSDTGQLAYAHPLLRQLKDSDPISVESEILKLKPFSAGLSRTKKLIEPKTGKDNSTQGDKPSTGCVACSLSKAVSWAQGHSHVAEQGPKTVDTRLPFPTKLCWAAPYLSQTHLMRRCGRRNTPGSSVFPEKNKVNEIKVIGCDRALSLTFVV